MQLGVEVPESGAAQPDTSLPFHLCAMSTGLPELNSEVVVEGEEGRHAVSVRRLRTGESVVLIDGTGAWVQGPAVGLEGRDRFTMVVRARGQAPPVQPRLVVVQALPKNERADEAIDPAVGLVMRVSPGDRVRAGDVLADVHGRDAAAVEQVSGLVREAIDLGDAASPRGPLVLERVS